MKNQRKILISVLLLTIYFLASNFEVLIRGRTEIEALYPILVAGIDMSYEDSSDYLVTVVSPPTEENVQKTNNIISMTGETVFEANRKIGMYAENDIFWGHTKYVLIGEDAAKRDLLQNLDFFMRDHEPRVTIQPLIVYGMDSQEAIANLYVQNIDIFTTIERTLDNVNLLSYSSSMSLIDFIDLVYDSQDGYLPCIQLETEQQKLIIEQGTEQIQQDEFKNLKQHMETSEDYVMHISGYALIKDGCVVDYLLNKQGRGLNWIINQIQSGVIVIEHNGVKYNLEITKGGSKILPSIEDGQLSAEVNISVETSMTEINEQNVTITEEIYEILEEKVEQLVKSEVDEVIGKLQKLEIDIIGLGDKFYHEYPVKWEREYKDEWEDLFSKVDISVDVDCIVVGSSKFMDSIIVEGN